MQLNPQRSHPRGAEAETPATELAHQLFERQASRTPAAIAAQCGKRTMTYRDLDRRANAVAFELRTRGIGPDHVVGLLAERSLDMVVALLGILKSGGAFLPLDPGYPAERLAYMLRDSGARLIVATHGAAVPAGLPASIARLTIDTEAPAGDTPAAPPSRASVDNLAYVIYTSGSTGTPKGVMVSHRGLPNLARSQIRAFRVDATSRVLQFASPSFDASVSEVLMALLSGARLVFASAAEMRPGAELVRTLREQRITTVTLPPSVLALLSPEQVPDLATVISAGEALSAELCATWSRATHLINAYGPSETTVCATLDDSAGAHGRTVTIGHAIDNTSVYLLDGALEPVAAGTIGEIYVSGIGLARGYANRPGLTAERFLPDPVSTVPGARMYRTGDLARVLPTGELEFIGRADSQIKIRGFRIELGEIDHALRSLPAVREVAVCVREQVLGQSSLVAFVLRADASATASAILSALAAKLASYMIPSLVFVEGFPLTANGKIDRAALLALPVAGPVPVQAPRDEVEQMIATMWQSVLGVEDPDVLSDFFAIGGDSLKAAMVSNALSELLGEVVYVVAVFDNPTIAALADYLRLHYTTSLARVAGEARQHNTESPQITQSDIVRLRAMMGEFSPYKRPSPGGGTRNNRAIFVLSPPRSGSTLFRVMLAGHPQLFVPQELGLLAFERLGAGDILANGYEWISQGTIRALMQIHGWSTDEAKKFLALCEQRGMPSKELYAEIQSWVAPKILVDKTTTYALDSSILDRAESDFDEPFYVHLLRHPCGMIRSFEKVRMDRFFFRWADRPLYSPRRLAELVWLICHQNTLDFLSQIPAHRQIVLRYEDVVRDPEREMRRLCDALGLPFDERMTEPHRDKSAKMLDGIHADPASRQIGDPNFHKHDTIDERLAEAWRAELSERTLGDITRALAAELGYGQ